MKSINKTNIFYMALVLFYMLVSFLINFVPDRFISVNFALSLGEIIIIIPTIIYLVLTKFKPIRQIRIKSIRISNIFILILLTYLCMPFLSLLNYITMFFADNIVTDIFGLIEGNPLYINLFFIAVLPAVCEEFVFRGILFHSYRNRNIFKAILISAFMFGLMHLNINQFLYAFAMGIIFAFVVEATGSILSSVIMHFIINANSVLIYFVYSKVLNLSGKELESLMSAEMSGVSLNMTIIRTFVLIIMALIGLTLAVMVYYWLCYRNGTLQHVKNIIKSPFGRVSNNEHGRIVSIPLLIGLIICVIYIIYFDFII